MILEVGYSVRPCATCLFFFSPPMCTFGQPLLLFLHSPCEILQRRYVLLSLQNQELKMGSDEARFRVSPALATLCCCRATVAGPKPEVSPTKQGHSEAWSLSALVQNNKNISPLHRLQCLNQNLTFNALLAGIQCPKERNKLPPITLYGPMTVPPVRMSQLWEQTKLPIGLMVNLVDSRVVDNKDHTSSFALTFHVNWGASC